jgi:LacI family transcriptional regulator
MVDVAREASVSLKTVSRVVNGAPNVDPDYARRVREAIDKLGFVRNNIARDLRSNSETAIVGLVIGDLGNTFYSLLARSIERVARRNGSLLLIASSEEDPQRERELITELCERRVDGLIVVPAYADHSFCAEEMRRGLPMVFLDRHPAGIEADTVMIDNDEGAFMGARALFERGHERIAVIGQDIRLEAMAQRLAGVTRAAAAAGAGLDDALVRFGPLTPEQAGRAADELLSLPDPPTAFFCCTNRIAQGVINQVWQRGLKVDVAGFDNIESSHCGPGPVATVAYDIEELGRRSAELLFRRIDGDRGTPEDVIVPVTLIEAAAPGG